VLSGSLVFNAIFWALYPKRLVCARSVQGNPWPLTDKCPNLREKLDGAKGNTLYSLLINLGRRRAVMLIRIILIVLGAWDKAWTVW
jgi:hypothetical protein